MTKYQVKESGGTIETNEVFLDSLAHQKEAELGVSEKKFEIQTSSRVMIAIFTLFALAVMGLFARTWYLQVDRGRAMTASAQDNKGRLAYVAAERGVIYDRNGKQLVTNAPAYDLTCQKKDIAADADYKKEITDVSQLISEDPRVAENAISASKGTQVTIASDLDQQKLLVLEAKISSFGDCQLQENTARNYVLGPALAQVMGYMGRITQGQLDQSSEYNPDDLVGQAGLEEYYQDALRGEPGETETVRDAAGQQKKEQVISQPKPGDNLVLNIDSGLQQVIYDSLAKKLQQIGAQKGAAVAMDPNTGQVLAMVSYPSYNDNLFSEGISQADFDSLINNPSSPMLNRVIAGKYPTGSVIKPLEASAALQEHLISPEKQIYDPGYILVHSQYDPSVTYRFGGVEPHGWVDMRKALAVSSNIYFYTVGGGYGDQPGLGPTRIKKYLSLFGWNQKTGVDLPGEFSGFIPDPEWKQKTKGQPWYDGDTYNLSIGQSDMEVTPLQVAMAYSAIANGGALYQPQVVNHITDSSTGQIVKQFSPQLIRQGFIDPANLEIVREGMRDGVDKPYGLSGILNNLPVEVAAKTGTAQIGSPDKFNLWSAAFAPYDHPQIVVVVTAERVHALGAVTLPVAHDALEYWFGHKIPADLQASPTPVPNSPAVSPASSHEIPSASPADIPSATPAVQTSARVRSITG